MCGIAGVYFFKPDNIPNAKLRAIADSLSHRGPDGEGIYSSDRVVLIHRRLKIIDLSDIAAQPMQDEGRRYALLFNGEIYNFRQLKSELSSQYQFFSRSDTEVILRSFQQWGAATWPRLNGMFTIALYDSHEEKLFLARDHAGIKPLYFYADSEKFFFSSELQSLIGAKLFAPEIDSQSLSLYLQFGYFPANTTPYKHVRKLLPGELLEVSRSGVTTQKFWSFSDHYSAAHTGKIQHAAAADQLDGILQKAVERQMISDVPLGAFLSGGIDSSLIVALMTRISADRVKTFTVGFEGLGYYDERPHARKIAEQFNTEHHEFVVRDRVSDLIPQVVSVLGEPFADSSAIPTFCLARLARQSVTVALSGTGADELFGGYRKYLASQWTAAYLSLPQNVRDAVQKASHLLPGSRTSLWKERALLWQRFSKLATSESPAAQFNAVFSRKDAEALLGITAQGVSQAEIWRSEDLMLFDYQYYLPEDLLVKEDRCTMAFALESRVPYLDREIVEFVGALPMKFKVTRTKTKRLFKHVAARYLPSTIVRRPKHGFGSPVAEWLRNELRSMATEMLFSPAAFLKSPLISSMFEEHVSGVADHSKKLWAVLMLEMWNQQK